MDTIELQQSDKHWSTNAAQKSTPNVRERDSRDMRRMGKEQEFRRNFRVISISSFSLATMMGFVFIPINGTIMVEIAGTGGTIVIYITNFFGFLTIVLSLAEMSSM